MSKMIDGNKLILALSDWWYSSFGLKETEESKAIHKVLDEVEKYVEHEKSAGGWIPCSERLPNTNGIYIVTRRRSDGFECRNLTDACYFDGTSTWHDDTRVNHGRKYLTDVLAWMPLPEPYRGDGEL